MKKRLIFTLALVFALVLALSIVAFAEDAVPAVTNEYYLVQSVNSEAALALKASGVSDDKIVAITALYGDSTASTPSSPFFGTFEEGSHIKMTLAENLYSSQAEGKGILLNTAITVTIVYNGYVHVATGSGRYNLFTLRHKDATLRMIGSNGLQSDQSTTLIAPTVNNGVISGNTNLDIRHADKVYVWVFDGNVYAENMRAQTKEEFVYSETGTDSNQNDKFEFRDCVSNLIALLGQGASRKEVVMDNCYLTNLAIYTACTGSKITNCTIENNISMDSWAISGQALVMQDCILKGVSTGSGRTDLVFIDCKVKSGEEYVDFSSANVSLADDGGGKTVCAIVKTADCENPTQVKLYVGGGKTEITYDYYVETITTSPKTIKGNKENVVAVQSIVLEIEEAKGHTTTSGAIAIRYTDGFDKAGYIFYNCSECNNDYSEQSAEPIFTAKGYSYKLDTTNGSGISSGYVVNREALSAYEKLSEAKLDYGVVMFNVNSDQAKQALDKLFENGVLTITEKALQVKATEAPYTIVNFTINGFKGDSLSIELAIALFVNEVTTVEEQSTYETSFVQSSKRADDDQSPIHSTYTNGGVTLSTVTCQSVTKTAE